MRRTIVVTLVGLLGLLTLPALVLAAATGASPQQPTPAAQADIPPAYLAVYQDAAARRCPTLPWSVLAAIGKVESDHGRMGGARLQPDGSVSPRIIGVGLDGSPGVARILDTDRGRYDGDTTYDRAVGPMQFIPGTWAAYGLDANGSGTADPHNAVDAIHSAANYLCASGASDPARVSRAILAYNRSTTYRDRVLEIAAGYAATGVVATASPTLIAMVLANPRLDIYPAGRDDIAAGRIDVRVLTVLQLLSERHTLTVVSLKTGHSRCIGGGDHAACRVSHHWHGRAVDIAAIDGRPVKSTDATARAVGQRLHELPQPLRPSEVGTPWADLSRFNGFFSDAAHTGHLHVGWSANERRAQLVRKQSEWSIRSTP